MFLKTHNAKDPHYYIMQTFRREDGGTSTRVHMNLGTASEICREHGCTDALAWAKSKLDEINNALKDEKATVMIPFRPGKEIEAGKWRTFHCGHLVLLPLYNKLGLDKLSAEIKSRYRFKYDFAQILRQLVMARILFPDSKRATRQELDSFIDTPGFSLDDIYNFLSVLAKEITPLQRTLYEATKENLSRRTGIIYYDCTNYYFEIEKEDDFRKYGKNKEHRPNPIVQMGLFMDADGLPLAFCMNPGNTNEQTTMKPLEEILANEFNLSEFVVCTDAGLSSIENRLYNTTEGRNYIVTQSIPGLPARLKEWALEKKGWRRLGDKEDKSYDITELDLAAEKQSLYYKDQWQIEDRGGIKNYEERLIVTFSPKYALYQKEIRQAQIARAQAMIDRKSLKSRQTQQDPRRLISTTHCTPEGEVAEIAVMSLDEDAVQREEQYDGLNCVATKLDDSVGRILKANGFRYEVEHLFRITKSEFEARPVYLRLEDRIKAHFAICFVALLLLKAFQMQLNKDGAGMSYSTEQIINALSGMDYLQVRGTGYIPAYTATPLRSKCCRISGVPIDKEIIPARKMKSYTKC